jgi:alanine-glyoxylate transaminase/serine-glyoxylate transaminase/serine-pyruvate transaminase
MAETTNDGSNEPRVAGRHFLQIPGPSNVPDRVLRAIDNATIDHRGPAFRRLAGLLFEGLQSVFRTRGPVVIYPASGTGAWEAALVNTLSPGDRVLMFDTGYFAGHWHALARRLGLDPLFLPGDWHRGVDPAALEAALADDRAHAIKAVCVVHNETSTGVVAPVAAVRAAIDRVGHPALLMIDAVSSLACLDYRHDAWGVDVTIASSQKGLMLPPGLSFNAVGERALAAAKGATLPRSYWDWGAMLEANRNGSFPFTPATNLLYGLEAALAMLREEGLDNVFARHARLGGATRAAVRAWGLEPYCRNPDAHSDVVTAVVMPAGHDADALRRTILDADNMSLGAGLGPLAGTVFRIGHLGDLNALTLCGALAGVEMGLARAVVPHRPGGVAAAMDLLAAPPG